MYPLNGQVSGAGKAYVGSPAMKMGCMYGDVAWHSECDALLLCENEWLRLRLWERESEGLADCDALRLWECERESDALRLWDRESELDWLADGDALWLSEAERERDALWLCERERESE